MRTAFWLRTILAGCLSVGCSGEDDPRPSAQGGEGQGCYPNGTCNEGLTCLSDLCVDAGDAGGSDAATSDAGADANVDASSDAGSDAHVDAGFVLSSIPGLALWLRADVGVMTDNGYVTKWADQSGNGNDATTASTSVTVSPSAVGGEPALVFGGALQMLIEHDASLQPGASDYLVAAVARVGDSSTLYSYEMSPPLPQGQDYFMRLGTTGGHAYGQFFAGPPPATQIQGTVNLGATPAPRVFVLRRLSTTSTLELRVDGAVAASATAASIANSLDGGNPFTLGVGAGETAELVLIIGKEGAEQVTVVESHLRDKYGI